MREVKGENKAKSEKRQNAGITLIALVITIIVLLILAGVSIATLTGDNGIFSKSSEAKKESEIASVKEQAQLDISNYVAEKLEKGEDSTVNTPGKVQEILDKANENNENKYYAGYTQTGVKTPSGYEVPYEELYTAEGVTDVSVSNYGDKVDYKSKDSSLTWRIFYDDEDYVYLISSKEDGSNTVESCILSEYLDSPKKYSGSADITDEFLKSLNGIWFTALAGNSNTNNNARAVAYLMDQEVWKDYKDENASYAIGGPTLELFINSFNATSEENERGFSINISTYVPDGYTQQSGVCLYKEYNNEIYNNGTNYWLASPRNFSGNQRIHYVNRK